MAMHGGPATADARREAHLRLWLGAAQGAPPLSGGSSSMHARVQTFTSDPALPPSPGASDGRGARGAAPRLGTAEQSELPSAHHEHHLRPYRRGAAAVSTAPCMRHAC
jgi:hypothetical protein